MKRQYGLTVTCCNACHAEIASGAVLTHEFPYLPYGQLTNVCCRIEQARLHWRKDPMTDEELATIAHRLDSASSEPWEIDQQGDLWRVYCGPTCEMELLMGYAADENQARDTATVCEGARGEGDADFIAHARSDIPILIAEIDRLREEVRRLREQRTEREPS